MRGGRGGGSSRLSRDAAMASRRCEGLVCEFVPGCDEAAAASVVMATGRQEAAAAARACQFSLICWSRPAGGADV